MIEELTFRGHYEVTATYFKNDIISPPLGTESYMVCDSNTSINEYPNGWIPYPEWRERQINRVGRNLIIEALKVEITKQPIPFEKVGYTISLIDKIIYGL